MPDRFELGPGLLVEPNAPTPNMEEVAASSRHFHDYAAVVTGKELATFCIEVRDEAGGKALATKAWNALWLFHLLSIACHAPCFPLYAISVGKENLYSSTNRNTVIRALPDLTSATLDRLCWARNHREAFDRLISNPEFSSAMRCYGNAHYLFDLDVRIMLIWAGIEGLLSVDGELNRRIALYAALMLDGTADEKIAYFNEVKKAYGLRSRAVHGGKAADSKLREGYHTASRILSRLLARCVELGRVPNAKELDSLAISQSVR